MNTQSGRQEYEERVHEFGKESLEAIAIEQAFIASSPVRQEAMQLIAQAERIEASAAQKILKACGIKGELTDLVVDEGQTITGIKYRTMVDRSTGPGQASPMPVQKAEAP
jgi:hypothetical protein